MPNPGTYGGMKRAGWLCKSTGVPQSELDVVFAAPSTGPPGPVPVLVLDPVPLRGELTNCR